MKKLLYLLLISVMVLSLVFTFASCDENGNINIDKILNGGNDKNPDNTDDTPGDDTGNTPGGDTGEKPDDKPTDSHTHDYSEEVASDKYLKSAATCTSAAEYYYSCECGEADTESFTYGEAKGHTWQKAGCTTPETCRNCSATRGTANGHSYIDGSCVNCGETDPDFTPDCEHNYVDGTCTECGAADPDYVPVCEHVWVDPTCTEDGYCELCKAPGESAKGHSFTDGSCVNCGETDPDFTPDCEHNYVDGTCTECGAADPGYVPVCEHVWVDPTCTEDGYCELCKEPGESAKGHSYADGSCVNCGEPDPDFVPDCEHVWVAPTCTEDGYCELCKEPGESAKGHSFTDGSCVNCGEPDPDFVPDCEHDYKATITGANCEEDGFRTETCKLCGYSYVSEIIPALGHYLDETVIPATCTAKGAIYVNCRRCDYSHIEYTSDPLGHSFDGGICTACRVPDPDYVPGEGECAHEWVAPTCTEDGYCSICNLAGEYAIGHRYINGYCENCGDPYTAECAHVWVAPTCTEDGYCELCKAPGESAKGHSFTDGSCVNCGEADPDFVPECAHVWVDPTCTEDGYCELCKAPGESAKGHSFTDGSCGNCGATDPTYTPGDGGCEHKYEVAETFEATCMQQGYVTYACIYCGSSYSEYTDFAEHVIMTRTVEPTCTMEGYTVYYCANCGFSYQDDFQPMTDHSWTEGNCSVPAYCIICNVTSDVVYEHEWTYYSCDDYERCIYCGVMSGNPPLGHDFAGGFCTRCGTECSHSYETKVEEPTCNYEGSIYYYCMQCDYSYFESLGFADHVLDTVGNCTICGGYFGCEHEWTEPTCTEDGYCINCKIIGEVAFGHTEGEWVITEHPTCQIDGQSLLFCSTCGEVIGEETLPSMGHNYVGESYDATCTEQGYTYFVCSVCGENYIEYGNPATGHNYGYNEEEIAPTCNELGYTLLTCHCGESVKGVVFTPALGHTWGDNGTCTVCDAPKPSEGFEFTYAEDVNVGGYYKITGLGSCADTHVIIPDVYEGYPVRHIAKLTGGKMESIEIPDSVVLLDWAAFRNCTSLTEIVIPKDVIYIDVGGFDGCSSLERITVADENEAFKSEDGVLYTKDGSTLLFYPGAKKDESLVIPDGVACIGGYAFTQAKYLKSVTFPEGFEKQTVAYAFYKCTSLEEVILPSTIKEIYLSMFYDCSNLKSINLPDGLITIHTGAFYGCSSLTEIIIPDSVLGIGNDAFSYCTSLESVKISAGLTVIQQGCFYRCTSLKSVIIPDSVEKIEYKAFEYCTGLDAVVLGSGIKNMGTEVFASVVLPCVYYNGTAEQWEEILPNISYLNEEITSSTIAFYSESAPTEDGSFWHYVDGVPTLW